MGSKKDKKKKHKKSDDLLRKPEKLIDKSVKWCCNGKHRKLERLFESTGYEIANELLKYRDSHAQTLLHQVCIPLCICMHGHVVHDAVFMHDASSACRSCTHPRPLADAWLCSKLGMTSCCMLHRLPAFLFRYTGLQMWAWRCGARAAAVWS